MQLPKICLFLAGLTLGSASGATLIVDGSVYGLSLTPLFLDSAQVTDSLLLDEFNSFLVSGGHVGSESYAWASFGQLGVTAASSLGLTREIGSGASSYSATVPARASAYAEDYLNAAGLAPTDRIFIDVELEGIIVANPSASNLPYLSSVASIDLTIRLGGTTFRYQENGDSATITGTNYVQTGPGQFRVWSTGSSGSILTSAALVATSQCHGTVYNSYVTDVAAVACTATSDYRHTLNFLGAGAMDANGNVIPLPSGLVSQSGFDYEAGVATSEGGVPEPASGVLVATAILPLVVTRRKHGE